MNWLTKIKTFGDKIKKNLQKKFPTQKEQLGTPWISCCSGPQLKSTIFNEEQLNTCPNCNKHYPFTPRERFDNFYKGKNNQSGIGLGLSIAKKIVSQQLQGDICVQESDAGAHFLISLPK